MFYSGLVVPCKQMLPFVADVSLIVHRNEPDDDTN